MAANRSDAEKYWNKADECIKSIAVPEWVKPDPKKQKEDYENYEPSKELLYSLLLIQKKDGKFAFDNSESEYKYPKLIELAKTEHRRFTYDYASEGWGRTKRTRFTIAFVHGMN